ncbi:MAG: hypothetical protein ACR2O0_11075 [Rhizobiaceae bacterium]
MLGISTSAERKWTKLILHNHSLKLTKPESVMSALTCNLIIGFMTLVLAGEISKHQDLGILGLLLLWAAFCLPCVWLVDLVGKSESKIALTVADQEGIRFWEIRQRLGTKVLGWGNFRHAETDGPALLLNIKPSAGAPTARQRAISCIRVGLLDPELAESVANELNSMKASR